VLTTSENSTRRLDQQVERGGVVDLSYVIEQGLTLLLRGRAKQGLCVAITDSKTNSSVFIGIGGVVDLSYVIEQGLTLLLRGRAKQGLCVAITDSKTNSSSRASQAGHTRTDSLEGGKERYVNSCSSNLVFNFDTHSSAFARLLHLAMPRTLDGILIQAPYSCMPLRYHSLYRRSSRSEHW
jgi:hypothetical protein